MLQRVLPPGAGVDPESSGTRQTLLEWYAVEEERALRLNFVTTLDGRAAGSDGTSDSLTTRTDRMILGVIRETSDAVFVGARTVREESLARPRRTPLVILSASGDLSGHGLAKTVSATGEQLAHVIVVTTPEGESTVRRTLTGTEHELLILEADDDGRLDLGAVLAALHERGLHRIVAEGGPSLASSLISAGLVDELCLTVVPRIGGTGIPVLDGADSARLLPRHLLVDDDGVQYGRWTLSRER